MKSTVSTLFFTSAVFVLALGCNNDRAIPGFRSGAGGAGGGFIPVSICGDATAPSGCGQACGRDGDCPTGTHCASSFCDAVCDETGGCDAQSVCSDRGRCDRILPEGGMGGMVGCINDRVTPTRIEPNVMFLVDRSGSMDRLLDGTPPRIDGNPNPEYNNRRNMGERTRWEIAHDAIAAVLTDLDALVQFGLATYSDEPSCLTVPIISIAPDNAPTILASYLRTTDPAGFTPTAPSYQLVVDDIVANPPTGDGPTIVVLATDGEPNQCGSGNSTRTLVVDTVEMAFDDNGVQTFALSVGTDVGQDHLQEVANVGVGLNRNGSQGDAMFWVGDQAEELEQAFRTIVNAQITCELNLNGIVEDLARVCEGDVRLNGMPLVCGTDWRLKPGTNDTIELLGSACDTWRMGEADITAEFPCGIIQPN